MNILSLLERTVPVTESVRRWLVFRRDVERPRTYLEYAIDGAPLRELASGWDASDAVQGFATKLTENDPYEAIDEIDTLLGRMGLEPGDYQGLLYYPDGQGETADGLAAQLSFQTNRVVWSNFALGDASPWYVFDDSHRIETAPAFTFDRTQYEAVLLGARERYVRYIAGPKHA